MLQICRALRWTWPAAWVAIWLYFACFGLALALRANAELAWFPRALNATIPWLGLPFLLSIVVSRWASARVFAAERAAPSRAGSVELSGEFRPLRVRAEVRIEGHGWVAWPFGVMTIEHDQLRFRMRFHGELVIARDDAELTLEHGFFRHGILVRRSNPAVRVLAAPLDARGAIRRLREAGYVIT